MKSSLQIIRPKELAELLSISIPTLYRIQDELPPKIKLSKNGRAVGWRRSDIENWMEGKKKIQEGSSCSVNFNQSFVKTED